jgi:hypothetical protein
MSDDSDEDDNEEFDTLINEVWKENQSQFDKKLNQLMEENSNFSKTEAREEVSEMMLLKDRNLLVKKYKRLISLLAQLNRSKLHRDIEKETISIMEKKDIELEKALSRAFIKYRHEIDQVLESDDSFYHDITEEESGDKEMDE